MAGRRIAVSNSFTIEEVKVLDFIFTVLQRGGDPKGVVRNKSFVNLRAKIVRMRDKLNAADTTKKTTKAPETNIKVSKDVPSESASLTPSPKPVGVSSKTIEILKWREKVLRQQDES